MQVDWIELTDFRSYRRLEWRPDPGVNLVVGPNGAGKTNALEAVAYLATMKSFRGVTDDSLVADGAQQAYLRSGVRRGGGADPGLVEIEIPRQGARRVQVNRQRLRRTADLLEVLRVVTFLPEDLDIVKGGPGRRRDLLDEAAIQLRPATAADLAEYERALRQRNALLKMGVVDTVTLDVWDERLSQAGGRVMARRMAAMSEIGPYLEESYRAVSGSASHLSFWYTNQWGGSCDPSVPAGEQAGRLAESIANHRRYDIERRVTSVGPHRDDPALLLDEHDVRVYGSQGEQRTTALALRLALHRAVTDRVGSPPVLILDDVFSELDQGRAEKLAVSLPSAQTLISSARPEDVPIRGRRWRVVDRNLEQET